MELVTKLWPEAGVVKVQGKNLLQYWESDATRPHIFGASAEGRRVLERLAEEALPRVLRHPFLSRDEIRQEQFTRIQELVDYA